MGVNTGKAPTAIKARLPGGVESDSELGGSAPSPGPIAEPAKEGTGGLA